MHQLPTAQSGFVPINPFAYLAELIMQLTPDIPSELLTGLGML
jgi:hypothetical protein